MKPSVLSLLLCAVSLLVGCAILDPRPDAEIGRSIDSAVTDPSKLSGEAIYRNDCTTCHNIDGSPVDSATVEDLRGYSGTYQKFDSTLNEGPGAMPIYTYAQLDSAARVKLYNHVRGF